MAARKFCACAVLAPVNAYGKSRVISTSKEILKRPDEEEQVVAGEGVSKGQFQAECTTPAAAIAMTQREVAVGSEGARGARGARSQPAVPC